MAFALTILMIGILLIGVRESARFNSFINALNVFVILFIIAFGSIKIDLKNWQINPLNVLNMVCLNNFFF